MCRFDLNALGIIATGVFRPAEDADKLNLHTSAITGGIDFRHRFWNDNYQITGFLLGSRVSGSEETIAQTQQSPVRYLQRPDADHFTFDPTRTSLTGTNFSLDVSKVGGGFLQYGANLRIRDPGFEANDLGFMQRADFRTAGVWLGYNRYLPTKHFRGWSLNTSGYLNQDHSGERTGHGASINMSFSFPNYWDVWGGTSYNVDMVSTGMLRGGPAAKIGDMFGAWGGFHTDGREELQFNVNLSFNSFLDSNSNSYSVSPGLYWRPMGRLQLSLGAFYMKNESDSQWVTQITSEREHYVFARIAQETIGLTGRLDLAFTPNLSLQLYLQPFVSAGQYSQFKQIADPKADNYEDRFDDVPAQKIEWGYLTDVDDNDIPEFIYNPDFNFKQFRSNVVLRWEYRPGSTLFLVWSQGREHSDQTGQVDYGSDMGTLFDAASDDVFLVKASYWY